MRRQTTSPGGLPPALVQALQKAIALHRQGRLDAAIKAYRRVLRKAPDFPQAHNNLGVALKAAGRLPEAVTSYRRAIAARPGYAAAHANLSGALAARGEAAESLKHALEAVRCEPDNPAHRPVLAQALRPMRFSEASPAVREALLACFADPGLEHQLLIPAALSLLRLEPAVAEALARAADPAAETPAALVAGAFDGALRDRLFQTLLVQGILADADFERLLTVLRRAALETGAAEGQATYERTPGFWSALACQCYLTDYVFDATPAEAAAVAALAESAPAAALAARDLTWELLRLALYRPLAALPEAARLGEAFEGVSGPGALLLRRQLAEPLEEARLAEALPSLTAITDATSVAVRAQYEAHPYPRWLATRAREARPLAAVVEELFPHLAPYPQPAGPTRVLVAGCGTGKHAVDVATRYAGAEVLALDLSRRSLGFAQRQARERGLSRIEFAQADLMALAALERRFHLVESVGVLHHLAEPLAGWRVLAGLLEPGGLMRVGLYSRLGRRHIAAARALIAERGFADDEEGIRAARDALRQLDPAEAARGVTGELDFYGLASCHDLLFNVQEASFTLPGIAEALDALGLEFLGFELADAAPAALYARRFPKDRTMIDLARWAEVEAEAPESFAQMYQFWCRKR